jgi:hypothetical protein
LIQGTDLSLAHKRERNSLANGSNGPLLPSLLNIAYYDTVTNRSPDLPVGRGADIEQILTACTAAAAAAASDRIHEWWQVFALPRLAGLLA